MTMIFCPECSLEIAETAKSCPNCGNLLNKRGVEYEYMTLSIDDCMNKFQSRYWMIPDVPRPGVIPPTIDEIKEMYAFDMTLKQPMDSSIGRLILKATPPGWELFERIGPHGIKLRITRSSGPLGWTTNYSFDLYVFHVRRALKKFKTSSKPIQNKKSVAVSKKKTKASSHTKMKTARASKSKTKPRSRKP
jgi:hypothetical protein